MPQEQYQYAVERGSDPRSIRAPKRGYESRPCTPASSSRTPVIHTIRGQGRKQLFPINAEIMLAGLNSHSLPRRQCRLRQAKDGRC